MPDEYDAFGRKVEDSGLGWDTSGTPTQSSPVESTPTTTATQFQTVTPPRPSLSKPRRNPLILLLQVAVVAGIIGAIVLALSAGKEANDTVRDTLNGFNAIKGSKGNGSGKVDDGDDKVPKQVKAASFFTAKGLRAGIKILAAEQPGRITNFSMRKDRINIQINRGGKSHNVQLSAGAEAPEEFSASTATQSGSDRTMTYEELNPTAPERLMKAANSRLNQSPKDVDYFVAQKFLGPLTWGVYYKGGRPIAQGDSRGRYTRRIS